MEIVFETRLNSLKRGSSDEVQSIHSCAFCEYTYEDEQNQEDQSIASHLKGKVLFCENLPQQTFKASIFCHTMKC